MRKTVQARNIDGVDEPTHTIEVVCHNCGYDLDEAIVTGKQLLLYV